MKILNKILLWLIFSKFHKFDMFHAIGNVYNQDPIFYTLTSGLAGDYFANSHSHKMNNDLFSFRTQIQSVQAEILTLQPEIENSLEDLIRNINRVEGEMSQFEIDLTGRIDSIASIVGSFINRDITVQPKKLYK